MEFIKPGTYFNVMRYRRQIMFITLVTSTLALISLFFPGPNYGIDFAGGTEIQLAFNGEITPEELRATLEEIGHEGADVVAIAGRSNEYMIRIGEVTALSEEKRTQIEGAVTGFLGAEPISLSITPSGDKVSLRLTQLPDLEAMRRAIEEAGVDVRDLSTLATSGEDSRVDIFLMGPADELVSALHDKLGDRAPQTPERVEWVGPKAGQQLRNAALISMLYTIMFIMVYVAFRFDLRFAPGAIIAMVHDVLLTMGIYVLSQKEMNLTTVAGVLTVLGYSINDTIVIFDRIRENIPRHREKSMIDLINLSTSQTLTRTIITGGTVLIALAAFFIWGTPVIQDLSFVLFCGIILGTYSSIFVATPITEWMDRRFFSEEAVKKRQARASRIRSTVA